MIKSFICLVIFVFITLSNGYSQNTTRKTEEKKYRFETKRYEKNKFYASVHRLVSVRITTDSSTISLYSEGFIYSKAPFSNKGSHVEAHYIPSYELDEEKVEAIKMHIHENELLTYSQSSVNQLEKERQIERKPAVISFIYYDNFEYSYFYYYECDRKINKLIELMNALIPAADRNEFEILTHCNKPSKIKPKDTLNIQTPKANRNNDSIRTMKYIVITDCNNFVRFVFDSDGLVFNASTLQLFPGMPNKHFFISYEGLNRYKFWNINKKRFWNNIKELHSNYCAYLATLDTITASQGISQDPFEPDKSIYSRFPIIYFWYEIPFANDEVTMQPHYYELDPKVKKIVRRVNRLMPLRERRYQGFDTDF